MLVNLTVSEALIPICKLDPDILSRYFAGSDHGNRDLQPAYRKHGKAGLRIRMEIVRIRISRRKSAGSDLQEINPDSDTIHNKKIDPNPICMKKKS